MSTVRVRLRAWSVGILLLGAIRAVAGSGDIDPDFGTGGLLTYPAGYWGEGSLPDGRLQLAAIRENKFQLRRYDLDGRPDPGFGTAGLLETGLSLGSAWVSTAAVASGGHSYLSLSPPGQNVTLPILNAAGNVGAYETITQVAARVMRITTQGLPDTAFGPEGMREFPFKEVTRANISQILNLAPAPGGATYVLVGYLHEFYDDFVEVRLFRLRMDGELDTGFGSGGHYTVVDPDFFYWNPPSLLAMDTGGAMLLGRSGSVLLLDEQGRPVMTPTAFAGALGNAARSAAAPGGQYLFTATASGASGLRLDIARWRQDLSPDNTFGQAGNGHAVIDLSGRALKLADYGRLKLLVPVNGEPFVYAMLDLQEPYFSLALVRLDRDGRVDRSFGDDGVVLAGGFRGIIGQQPSGAVILGSGQAAMRLAIAPAGSPGIVIASLSCQAGTGYTEGRPVNISVWRTLGSHGPVSIRYRTQGATAMPGADYAETSGTLEWLDGETGIRQITVPLIDDGMSEATEEFGLLLDAASGNPVISCPYNRVVITDTGGPAAPPSAPASPSIGGVQSSPVPASSGGGGGGVDGALLTAWLAWTLAAARKRIARDTAGGYSRSRSR